MNVDTLLLRNGSICFWAVHALVTSSGSSHDRVKRSALDENRDVRCRRQFLRAPRASLQCGGGGVSSVAHTVTDSPSGGCPQILGWEEEAGVGVYTSLNTRWLTLSWQWSREQSVSRVERRWSYSPLFFHRTLSHAAVISCSGASVLSPRIDEFYTRI